MRKDATVFDTDMFHFRMSPDPGINEAARAEFKDAQHRAMSSFSLLELKGNYIANLILLHKKIMDSKSLNQAYSRIDRTGGRKARVMLAQLITWLGGINFSPNPWEEARNQLITHIDSQIECSWHEFVSCVDTILDDVKCNRATEPPISTETTWKATIPKCRDSNTSCNILAFFNNYIVELTKLVDALKVLDKEEKTEELYRIKEVAEKIISTKKFAWHNGACRRVGDLIIGLQSKIAKELISSNYKEHRHLHVPLGYNFKLFDVKKYSS